MRRYEDRGLVAIRRVSWGALWAGNAVTCAALLSSGILGIVFANTTALGSAIWSVFCVIASFYIGGLVTGRLSGFPRREDAALHGILTWALTVVETFLVVSSWLTSIEVQGLVPEVAEGGMAPNLGQQILNAV